LPLPNRKQGSAVTHDAPPGTVGRPRLLNTSAPLAQLSVCSGVHPRRVALAAPLCAGADEGLRARLAAIKDSLELEKSKTTLEAGGKDEANACALRRPPGRRPSRSRNPRRLALHAEDCRMRPPSPAADTQSMRRLGSLPSAVLLAPCCHRPVPLFCLLSAAA
jgi:hypothetical protein